jgi:phage-related protein
LAKEVEWLGTTQRDLRRFPEEVRHEVGFALYTAELGEKALNVIPLVGFGGASVLEIISNHEGDAYRAVYTVQFSKAVYVLHVFQKKSIRGRATPKREMDLIRQRLNTARQHYEIHYKRKGREQDNAS